VHQVSGHFLLVSSPRERMSQILFTRLPLDRHEVAPLATVFNSQQESVFHVGEGRACDCVVRREWNSWKFHYHSGDLCS